MLQAYALQYSLSKLGVENEIINFRSNTQKSLIPPPIEFCHPRSSLRKLIYTPGKTLALTLKYRRFENFLNRELNITKELTTQEAVAKFIIENEYDAIITGSDQIWNPACWDFSTVYLCDFPYKGKKIAYAPSIGSHPEEILSTEYDTIIRLASQYGWLSTREKRGSDFLNRRLGREMSVVLDPTLLLRATDYDTVTSKKLQHQPYILYYTPREEKGYFRCALKFSDKLGINIVVTQDFEEYHGYKNVLYRLDCGPKEFLSLVKNAAYCIGNSFHLLAFSLIFHKEFFLLSRELDSRMVNMLEPIGLQSRLIHPDDYSFVVEDIDYESIDCWLIKKKKNSLMFLEKSLGI
jgi:hypothetical protein